MPLNKMHSWEASLHFRFFNNGLEQILDSFQKLVHGDMRNLGIEISRQFYLLEMKMSKVMLIILENLAKLMKTLNLSGKKTSSSSISVNKFSGLGSGCFLSFTITRTTAIICHLLFLFSTSVGVCGTLFPFVREFCPTGF